MSTSTEWQLADDAAERYETILVPTLLGPFAKALVDSVGIRPGDVVVDVGCGTGAAARVAAVRAGASGRVLGIDINAGMLATARRHHAPEPSAQLDWREGEASRLPLDDGSADVVLCAQTLQFLSDREGALREVHRILRPAGRMALSVWSALDANPYFDALARAVERHIDADTAKGLRAAFTLNDAQAVRAMISGAGFRDIAVDEATLELELPPLLDFVPRHIAATPMAAGYARAPEAARAAVVREVVEAMAPFAATNVARIAFRSLVLACVRS